MKAYHIKAWNAEYENAESRKLASLPWFKKSTKLLGEGIGHTLAQERGFHLYGIWTVLEILAAGSVKEQRGWLIKNDKPLDAVRIARLLRVPVAPIEEGLIFFSSEEIGWLEHIEMPEQFTLTLPGDSPTIKPTAAKHRDDAGTLPGDSPTIKPTAARHRDDGGRISATERETERLETEKKERETRAQGVPLESEILSWAEQNAVDPDYALAKFADTCEKHGWLANGKPVNWQKRWLRFWNADQASFLQKKRRAAAPGAPALPPEAKSGDQAWWWNDALPDVEAALQGAALGEDKKTAARLREILTVRKQSKR